MAKAPRLYRIIVPVGDIQRAAKYYGSLLGIRGRRVSPGRHYFNCGGVILALYNPGTDGDARRVRPLPEHIYFAVTDLESVYRRARRLGALAKEIGDGNLPMGKIAVRPWGERSFYLVDPFGNQLCFADAKTLFTGR
jgi:catechol 2,3-dioxygenase-like lactoylglutathione lyase family enzyme